ncbi:MAG: hypothetical protein V4724_20115 [Pseudomonadota bacterium]
MRRGMGQALRIGVSASALGLLRTSRWRSPAVTPLAEQAVTEQDGPLQHAIGLALRELLAGQDVAGWPVTFVLADELTRLWQVTPPQQAARLADIEAAAALRFQHLYGESTAAWQLSAGWDARAPFFAAAVPRALLAVLEQGAAEHRLAVVEVLPHFVTSWNRWQRALKPGAWFGQLHDGLLSVGIVDDKRLHAVRALPVPHGADAYWLTQTLNREALLAGCQAPALLQLCGQAPASWSGKAANAAHIACAMLAQARPDESTWSPASLLASAGCAA